MGSKRGTSCLQYLLVSRLLLEVEWKVMALLQANKAVKQTPRDIFVASPSIQSRTVMFPNPNRELFVPKPKHRQKAAT